MLNERILDRFKYRLEEYDCSEFNERGLDLYIEKKREEYRWESYLYLKGDTDDN